MAKIKLSPESYAKLLQNERNLVDIVAEIDNAEKCGIDCERYRGALKAQLAEIAQMKLYYSPVQGM
jgi:hypothetical protein